MNEQFHTELDKLKKDFVGLSSLEHESVTMAFKAISTYDLALAEKVISADDVIDAKEVELEEDVLKIFALHQPVAKDLRYLVALLKMNNDFERIADLAVNISKRVMLFNNQEGFILPNHVNEMTSKTSNMLSAVIDAVVNLDLDAARSIEAMDDEIDELNSAIYDIVRKELQKTDDFTDSFIHLLTVSRQVERIADHITNICEDLIYMLSGQIVRHQSL